MDRVQIRPLRLRSPYGKRFIHARFGIKTEISAQASRIIQLTVKDGTIRLYDPKVRDRDRSYVLYWA